jgi:phosphoglycerol transferase
MARSFAYYASHALLTAVLLALLVPFGPWPLRVPFDYSGDALIHAALIKGVAEEGPARITRIGAPFGADVADWPLGLWLPLGVTSLLYYATGHAGTAINLFWLLAIVATGLSAVWSMRRLGAPPGESFVAALLYAFLPYVFYRNVAHFGTVYPCVPLVALLCLRVAGLAPEEADRRERWVTLAACFAQGLAYVYYAFFACMLLAVAGVIGWWRSRRPAVLRLAASGILLLVLGTAIPLVPSVVYWSRHGRNPQLAYKTTADADIYGLKIRHLLTPIPDHPIGVFREAAARVARASFPNENENTSAKLGLLGSLGFLALLATAVAGVAGARPADSKLGPAAALTLAALLFSQVGGFGSVFNVFVAPDIRGYNRIVVFIGFFSLYAMAILLARVTAWWSANRPLILRLALLGAVAGFGVIDQVPLETLRAIRSRAAPRFAEDEAFVAVVESQVRAGGMVFQLPHGDIPLDLTAEEPRGIYDGASAYLSSTSLRWSWGSINGRTGEWQLSASKLSPAAMARHLTLAGFDGIWIDRLGYVGSDSVRAATLEHALVEATHSRLWTSARGRYSFVVLDDLRRRLEAGLEPGRYRAAQQEALGQVDRLLPRWREGCSDEEADAPEASRWCGPSAWGIFKNDFNEDRRFRLTGRLRAARPGRATLVGPGFRDDVAVTDVPLPYAREISIPAGQKLRLDLAFEGPCAEERGERRCLQLVDLRAVSLETDRTGSARP